MFEGLGPLFSRAAVPSSLFPSLRTSSVIVLSILLLPPYSIWFISEDPAVFSFRILVCYFLRIVWFFYFNFDCMTRPKWKSSSYWLAESSWYLADALINWSLSIFIMFSSVNGSESLTNTDVLCLWVSIFLEIKSFFESFLLKCLLFSTSDDGVYDMLLRTLPTAGTSPAFPSVR